MVLGYLVDHGLALWVFTVEGDVLGFDLLALFVGDN